MECISTPKFTLLINESPEGYSAAKRELRQGDPMPPLLFVLCMDYLTRILTYIGELQEFKFFTGCSTMKMNHLCFADDLLLFCKDEAKSAYLLLQGIKLFTESSGLQANTSKSALYSTAIAEDETTRISHFSGHFLWSGKAMSERIGHVRWDKVCSPKKYGGLGMRNIKLWNIAAVRKLVWHIGAQKDELWVRWVHSVYTKNANWWSFQPPSGASWIMKSLMQNQK
ncbi:uncharacterized protein LOC109136430 [Beta vulgaris subsp. vulgaris]|uniref:uncharacterized protein LOC109136430 n=1 Tax=Beta vulgaris subsp. vulgaris TaxID=3555 RepID=UPI0025478CBB|nr:uncharacterized protein LOC109136430 [Beta vulgaris subsp. vulgaris]